MREINLYRKEENCLLKQTNTYKNRKYSTNNSLQKYFCFNKRIITIDGICIIFIFAKHYNRQKQIIYTLQ
jgi:hypothetical protein